MTKRRQLLQHMPGDVQNNAHRGAEHPKILSFRDDIFKLTCRRGRRRNAGHPIASKP